MAKTSRPPRRKTSRVPNAATHALYENPTAETAAEWRRIMRPDQRQAWEKLPSYQQERLLDVLFYDPEASRRLNWEQSMNDSQRAAWATKTPAQQSALLFALYPITDQDMNLAAHGIWLRTQPVASIQEAFVMSPAARSFRGARLARGNTRVSETAEQAMSRVVDENILSEALKGMFAYPEGKDEVVPSWWSLTLPSGLRGEGLESFLMLSPDEQIAEIRDRYVRSGQAQRDEEARVENLAMLQKFSQPAPGPMTRKEFLAGIKRWIEMDFIPERAIKAGLMRDIQEAPPPARPDPETSITKALQKKINDADKLRAAVDESRKKIVLLATRAERANADPDLTARDRVANTLRIQGKLESLVKKLLPAERRLDMMEREIYDELLRKEIKYSGGPMYQAVDPFAPIMRAVIDPETGEPVVEPGTGLSPATVKMELVPLQATDPETGRPVIRVVNRRERAGLVEQYIIGRDVIDELPEVIGARRSLTEIFDDDAKFVEFCEIIGSNLRGSADPERLKEQGELIDSMEEMGEISAEKAEAAREILKPRQGEAYKEFNKLYDQAKRRQAVLGLPSEEPTDFEIGLAYLKRGRTERAAAAEFTKSVRALKRRTKYINREGVRRQYDEDVVDAHGNLVYAGYATRYGGLPLYSGSIPRVYMRVRGVSTSDRSWQRTQRAINDYIRYIEQGEAGVRRSSYASPARRPLAEEFFGALVKEYQKYSRSERRMGLRKAMSSAQIEKERNAPRDLLRIRDLIAEFNFPLPDWSNAKVDLSAEPLQEGGITWSGFVQRTEDAAAELGRKLLEDASDRELQMRLGDIKVKVKTELLTEEQGKAEQLRVRSEHARAVQLVARLKQEVLDYWIARGLVDMSTGAPIDVETGQERLIEPREIGMAYQFQTQEISAAPKKVSGESFRTMFGVSAPERKSQKASSTAGRARKAAELGRKLREDADEKLFKKRLAEIKAKVDNKLITKEEGDAEALQVRNNHNRASELVPQLEQEVLDHWVARGFVDMSTGAPIDVKTGQERVVEARDIGMAYQARMKAATKE